MEDCLFCKIVAGQIPSTKVYEDDTVLAFRDIQPQAPFHVLVIPKQHLSGASAITADNSAVVAHIFEVAAQLAREHKLDGGFRIITNCGPDAAQSVQHLHFHILAGRKLGVEMG